MQMRLRWIFLISSLLLTSAPALRANTVYSAHVEAELISEVTSIQPGKSFWMALRMKMDPNWHTYWLNPGDSGLAVTFDWKLPQGFEPGPIHWPYPQKIEYDPLVSYGYHGEIFLLVPIKVPESVNSGDISFQLKAQWLACENICIPGEGLLTLTLPAKNETPKANETWATSFAQARALLPLLPEQNRWQPTVFETEKQFQIRLESPSEHFYPLSGLYFFPERADLILHNGTQQTKKINNGYVLIIPKSGSKKTTGTLEGILISKEGWRGPNSEKAVRLSQPVSAEKPPALKTPAQKSSFWLSCLFALLGGLILNLMPCVLPVLSIKILNIAAHADEPHWRSISQGLLYTAGVLVSFWILAGALLIFRAGGEQIGWGFQLQSPLVVLFLLILFFLFALNLFDVFEIGTELTRVGNIRIRSKATASFLSGVLATTVATPCSAPFMGSAIGYSFTQPAPVTFAIFTFLGLGMALPYLWFSAFPSFLHFLPKPGTWMIRMKRMLAILLLGTCAWLLWVLSIQTGGLRTIPGIIFGLVLIGLAASLYGKWESPEHSRDSKIRAGILAAILFAAGLGSAYFSTQIMAVSAPQTSALQNARGISWQPYSDRILENLRREGKPVFIDFTAAWCLTCQVNEQLTFTRTSVIEKFKTLGIVALKADWTSRDPEITQALASYGRSSIPLYVVYKAGASEPLILPELITPEIVLKALEDV